MADNSSRIIEGKFTQTKPKRGFKYYFKWTIFVLIIIGILALYSDYKFSREWAGEKPKAENHSTAVNAEPTGQATPLRPAESKLPSENENENNEVKSNLNEIEKRLGELEERDNNLTIYLLVIDLKNSLNNPESFKLSLEDLQSTADGIPDFTGRLDILQQASDDELVTTEKLSADLEKLKEQLRNSGGSFGQNVRNIFVDLVRVTKVSGEVDKNDYDSIIKRAELRLAKGNLTPAELDEMIKEMQNIGKPAEEFVREANNLKRVLEVTDSLAASAKQRLAE